MYLKHPQPVARNRPGPLTEQEFLTRYNWLEQFVHLNKGVRPSMREIAAGWHVSVTAASLCLDTMEDRGWIDYARDAKDQRLDRGLVLRGTNGNE
jgi:DNA-binding MarR family transcriptional regulator